MRHFEFIAKPKRSYPVFPAKLTSMATHWSMMPSSLLHWLPVFPISLFAIYLPYHPAGGYITQAEHTNLDYFL